MYNAFSNQTGNWKYRRYEREFDASLIYEGKEFRIFEVKDFEVHRKGHPTEKYKYRIVCDYHGGAGIEMPFAIKDIQALIGALLLVSQKDPH